MSQRRREEFKCTEKYRTILFLLNRPRSQGRTGVEIFTGHRMIKRAPVVKKAPKNLELGVWGRCKTPPGGPGAAPEIFTILCFQRVRNMNSEHFRSDRIIFKFLTVLITGEHVKILGYIKGTDDMLTFWGTSRAHGGHVKFWGTSKATGRV